MKKTDFMKVMGRHDYVVTAYRERIKNPDNPKEFIWRELTCFDFTKSR